MSIPKTTYNKGIIYEDLKVGDEFVSASRTLTESDIWLFSCWSGDYNPLHTDEEFCKNGSKTDEDSRVSVGSGHKRVVT